MVSKSIRLKNLKACTCVPCVWPQKTLSITHHTLSPPPSHHHLYIIHLINWLQRFYRITMSLKRLFVPKSDVNQWFTTTTTRYIEFTTRYIELKSCYIELITQYIELSTRYIEFTTRYIELRSWYIELVARYIELRTRYDGDFCWGSRPVSSSQTQKYW